MIVKTFVAAAMAEFFAHATVQKQRLKCECTAPSPGVFDPLYWATCRHCGRALSLQMCIERHRSETMWRTKTVEEILADRLDVAEQERKKA